jgi:hypothetical protein
MFALCSNRNVTENQMNIANAKRAPEDKTADLASIASNVWLDDEMETIWKEVVVAQSSRNLPRPGWESHEIYQRRLDSVPA